MKKTNFILLVAVVSIFTFSCSKDLLDGDNPTSFTMTYNGQTYTQADESSLNIVAGMLPAKGVGADTFLLTIGGIGADGSVKNIADTTGAYTPCSVLLDFGAAAGKEAFVATEGTVSRNGKTININVTGADVSTLQIKTLSATILVNRIMLTY